MYVMILYAVESILQHAAQHRPTGKRWNNNASSRTIENRGKNDSLCWQNPIHINFWLNVCKIEGKISSYKHQYAQSFVNTHPVLIVKQTWWYSNYSRAFAFRMHHQPLRNEHSARTKFIMRPLKKQWSFQISLARSRSVYVCFGRDSNKTQTYQNKSTIWKCLHRT